MQRFGGSIATSILGHAKYVRKFIDKDEFLMQFIDLLRTYKTAVPPSRTAMTVSSQIEKEYKAHVRHPRILVSSRTLRYKANIKQIAFVLSMGQYNPEQDAILGNAGERRIMFTVMKDLHETAPPNFFSGNLRGTATLSKWSYDA